MNLDTYQYKYPHPAVTTDAVVFGFDGNKLNILLIERGVEPFKGCWALPGGFMKITETAEECAKRELKEETDISDIYLEQFHVFSDIDRDPRERVLSVAYIGIVRKSQYQLIAGDDASRAEWFETDRLPPLAFDHIKIIRMAKIHLQEIIRTRPIAFNLVNEVFSIPELQRIYEAITEKKYDRRNFAKQMNSTGFLEEVDERTCNCEESYSFEKEPDDSDFDLSASPAPKTQKKNKFFFFNKEAFDKDRKEDQPKSKNLLNI